MKLGAEGIQQPTARNSHLQCHGFQRPWPHSSSSTLQRRGHTLKSRRRECGNRACGSANERLRPPCALAARPVGWQSIVCLSKSTLIVNLGQGQA